ncbi:uncharacterized protein LOC113107050 isoform X4 [Carassius auratus]|uniref:Uncharacterized protein LOC113107050 isoform X4 n=1 Tax=Carassius auratus TaxID=7957 RepID=A0A6P6PW28_CARAU|nr:uncharacterized protein LOC113107050 isoform X4 [Carassius auratus]
MNQIYILLLALWSAFNSSDALYWNYPTTPAQTPYWRNVYYQTQTQAPSWRNPYYYATTQTPYWRNVYYQTQTQAPSWRNPYYYGITQAPSWRKPYYFAKTQPPYRRNVYYQTQTQAPSWRNPYYYATTQTPYWRNVYYQTQTQAPSWRNPYYYATTQTPYRRNVYYQTQTPFWRIQNGHHSEVPVPSITVFRQMEDKERVIVMCSFGRRLAESSFQLSLKSEYNYDLKNPRCFSNEECVFDVKVSPPVSFTCVHQINSVVNRQSETYTYSLSDFAAEPHYEGVSSFYIGFFSFIAVGLFIMTAAVIVNTVKSKAKGSITTGKDNVYTDV